MAFFRGFLLLGLLFFSGAAMAAPALRPSYGLMGIEAWNSLDDDDRMPSLRLDYHPALNFGWGVRPWIGLSVTNQRSLWAGFGIERDFAIASRFLLTPSFGAGYYAKGLSDLDLSHPIEFRTALAASYLFDTGHRLGVSFAHLSNAGLSSDNPGTEILGLYWTMPLQ